MTIKNALMGGTDWVAGDTLFAADQNDTFDSAVNWGAPVGTVLAWLKTYTNTPALNENWVECNGQTLSDADSVFNGQVIPDLNGDNRFLRGSSTSGTTGGSESHNHQWQDDNAGSSTGFQDGAGPDTKSWTSDGTTQADIANDLDLYTNLASTLPTYYEVVWVMKIK